MEITWEHMGKAVSYSGLHRGVAAGHARMTNNPASVSKVSLYLVQVQE